MINRYDNINIRIEGTTLIVEVELDPEKVDARPSASGKTTTFATTGGMRPIEGAGGMMVNMTVSERA